MVSTSSQSKYDSNQRRIRLNAILVALIQTQEKIELLEDSQPSFKSNISTSNDHDPASWLEKNKRVLKNFQSLVKSAITLDALMDAEQSNLQ